MDLAAAAEASALAEALRRSRWVYPVVNAGHILGVAMVVGAALPLDLRLARLWCRDLALPDVLRLLRPVAGAGIVLAALTGGLLFLVQASDYAAMPLFAVKLGLIALALANALLFGRRTAELSPGAQRAVGLASLALWLAVLICGRMLGYL